MNTLNKRSYISANEDRDYLLDYKSIDLSKVYRYSILDVPIDNVSRDEAIACILQLVEEKQGPHHIFFIDPIKLMQIRPGKKLDFIARDARLILADGAGVPRAAARLGYPLKERIPMIALLMDIVRLASKKDFTIFLLGSKIDYLEKVFFNFQRSFPGIRIIGRHGGYFDKKRETLIKEALRKSSPDIIFLGMGFGRQEKWLRDNLEFAGKAVVIGVDGALDVLSGKVKKSPDWAQLRGLNWLYRTLMRPWAVVRHFYLMHFLFLTFFRSILKKRR